MITGSWKTTIGGLITSAGSTMIGTALISDWMSPNQKNIIMLIGFIATIVGPFIHGLYSRDDDKSSEDVGLKQPQQEEKEKK